MIKTVQLRPLIKPIKGPPSQMGKLLYDNIFSKYGIGRWKDKYSLLVFRQNRMLFAQNNEKRGSDTYTLVKNYSNNNNLNIYKSVLNLTTQAVEPLYIINNKELLVPFNKFSEKTNNNVYYIENKESESEKIKYSGSSEGVLSDKHNNVHINYKHSKDIYNPNTLSVIKLIREITEKHNKSLWKDIAPNFEFSNLLPEINSKVSSKEIKNIIKETEKRVVLSNIHKLTQEHFGILSKAENVQNIFNTIEKKSRDKDGQTFAFRNINPLDLSHDKNSHSETKTLTSPSKPFTFERRPSLSRDENSIGSANRNQDYVKPQISFSKQYTFKRRPLLNRNTYTSDSADAKQEYTKPLIPSSKSSINERQSFQSGSEYSTELVDYKLDNIKPPTSFPKLFNIDRRPLLNRNTYIPDSADVKQEYTKPLVSSSKLSINERRPFQTGSEYSTELVDYKSEHIKPITPFPKLFNIDRRPLLNRNTFFSKSTGYTQEYTKPLISSTKQNNIEKQFLQNNNAPFMRPMEDKQNYIKPAGLFSKQYIMEKQPLLNRNAKISKSADNIQKYSELISAQKETYVADNEKQVEKINNVIKKALNLTNENLPYRNRENLQQSEIILHTNTIREVLSNKVHTAFNNIVMHEKNAVLQTLDNISKTNTINYLEKTSFNKSKIHENNTELTSFELKQDSLINRTSKLNETEIKQLLKTSVDNSLVFYKPQVIENKVKNGGKVEEVKLPQDVMVSNKEVAAKMSTSTKSSKKINNIETEEINLLAEKVYKMIEKRFSIQKDRRGLR